MKHKLKGVEYIIADEVMTGPNGKWGDCDPPTKHLPVIRIFGHQEGAQKVDTVIHEALHACFWDLSEESVKIAARDISSLLDRLGLIK